MRNKMNDTEIILGGCIGLVMGLIIIAYWLKKRKQRQEKIDIQIERVRLASKPGYRPPGRIPMKTSIKDGVITYRKDKDQKKEAQ